VSAHAQVADSSSRPQRSADDRCFGSAETVGKTRRVVRPS